MSWAAEWLFFSYQVVISYVVIKNEEKFFKGTGYLFGSFSNN